MTVAAVRVIGPDVWVEHVAQLLADVDVPVAQFKQCNHRHHSTHRKAEP